MPQRPRIVLADDELNLRKVLGAILQRDGYTVLEATDGEQALSLVDSSVAALITDLKMPRLDGMGVLRRVTVDFPEVPVIMITAHGSVDSAVEAVKLGAFDYIEKPFEQEHIRQVVGKAIRSYELDQRSARRQVFVPEGGPGRFGLIGNSPGLRS